MGDIAREVALQCTCASTRTESESNSHWNRVIYHEKHFLAAFFSSAAHLVPDRKRLRDKNDHQRMEQSGV